MHPLLKTGSEAHPYIGHPLQGTRQAPFKFLNFKPVSKEERVRGLLISLTICVVRSIRSHKAARVHCLLWDGGNYSGKKALS